MGKEKFHQYRRLVIQFVMLIFFSDLCPSILLSVKKAHIDQ